MAKSKHKKKGEEKSKKRKQDIVTKKDLQVIALGVVIIGGIIKILSDLNVSPQLIPYIALNLIFLIIIVLQYRKIKK